MSAYTTYMSNIEEALGILINDVVTKQKTGHPCLCATRTKARILSMFVDMIPLLYNCSCVSEEQFNQIQNLIIKLTGDPTIGLIDQTDLSCGGITTQIVHTTSTGGSGATINPRCASVNLVADVPTAVSFGVSLGSSGSDWVFMGTPFCYNTEGLVGFNVTLPTENGFTVTAIADSTFTYCAIKK